jgi:cytochrome c-type biogenesis protein CcmH/NrfG
VYLAMIEEHQGRTESAIAMYERVLKMRDYGNSHSIARTSINSLKKMN